MIKRYHPYMESKIFKKIHKTDLSGLTTWHMRMIALCNALTPLEERFLKHHSYHIRTSDELLNDLKTFIMRNT